MYLLDYLLIYVCVYVNILLSLSKKYDAISYHFVCPLWPCVMRTDCSPTLQFLSLQDQEPHEMLLQQSGTVVVCARRSVRNLWNWQKTYPGSR
jgi:hypothetical protein